MRERYPGKKKEERREGDFFLLSFCPLLDR
jgi:hypothetical protein